MLSAPDLSRQSTFDRAIAYAADLSQGLHKLTVECAAATARGETEFAATLTAAMPRLASDLLYASAIAVVLGKAAVDRLA